MENFILSSSILVGLVFISSKKNKTSEINQDKIGSVPFKKTKAFYDVQKQFEKDLDKMPIYVGADITRADKDKTYFYENGRVNDLFFAYITGFSFGQSY